MDRSVKKERIKLLFIGRETLIRKIEGISF